MLWQRRVMRWPLTAVLGLLVVVGVRALADDVEIEARMRRDVTYLASDECQGRGIETEGINKAADYIAAEFKKSGLKAGGPMGSFFQPFEVALSTQLDGASTCKLRGPLGQTIELRQGTDFNVLGFSGSGKVSGPLVFVGHGTRSMSRAYDDYRGVDAAGKVVVALRRTPRTGNEFAPFAGDEDGLLDPASLARKQGLAQANKAAALILVNDQSEMKDGDKLIPFESVKSLVGNVPVIQVRRAVMDMVAHSSLGQDLRDVEQAIGRDLKPRSAPLTGWTIVLEAKVQRKAIHVKNVVGMLDGRGPLAQETIVIGAHYDHLGFGGRGSLAKDKTKKDIHHGADDNASGTTALIELTRRFGHMKERQGRRLVFIAFSAEESGLLGSRYYCNYQPLLPLDRTAAMVNLDMVGRLNNDKLLIEGSGSAKTFDKLIQKLNGEPGFTLSKKPGGTGPSDHDSFYRSKIPVIFYWTGTHPDYHKPSDTADKINVPGMRRVTDLAERTVAHLAAEAERPEYVFIKPKFTSIPGKMPKLGIIPNYEEGAKGVLIGGVSEGGPAAAAGLKTGDRIVEIAGKAVDSMEAYMSVMVQQKSGQAIQIGVIREGQKVMLKVIPR